MKSLLIAAIVLLGCTVSFEARATKIRELAEIQGARDNQLVGYGVVTGLNGTGDDVSAPLATQSMLSMLRRLGVQVDNRQLRLKNIAAVVVTATIPAFAKPGTKLDIAVSSIGNSRSLEGGILVQTVMKGANRKSYAVAQGAVQIGGFAVKGRTGSKVMSGTTTSGRIPTGAIIEREIPTKFLFKGQVKLSLRQPSFAVAARMAKVLNENLGEGSAEASDGGTVAVNVPEEFLTKPVALIAQIQEYEVKAERRARVVVSERTQTIVAGGDVRLAPVAVVHGNLTIVVNEQPRVTQPAPLAAGETVVTEDSQVEVTEAQTSMQFISGAATLADLAGALGTLGLSARELISVLQALKTAGALEAELVVQ